MGSIERTISDFDIVIIGAGISGINAAYRVQTELPGYSYIIIESRDAIGGTWDLFRYPGIRSDSDLYTFGFPWRPWSHSKTIADGAMIRNYITETVEQFGIDRHIRLRHKLIAGNWSSDEQKWSLSVDARGRPEIFKARFIILGTGYYDYHEPLKTTIPGLENFKGTTIHPQFWPEDLDYTGKRVVIIGSGATAVTLLPVLAERASKVTMLQRSPTYMLSLPSVDPKAKFMRRFFPDWITDRILRWMFLIMPFLFFKFCQSFPNAARKLLGGEVKKQLPASISHDPNFKPTYNPWEQRLCICPDGDFFTALRERGADVVTDTIKTVTATGIKTNSGRTIDADVIVTATGLKMQVAGGAQMTVDGKPFEVNKKFMWKGLMLQDLPNAAFVMGYTNASWTLGADLTARLVCRLMKYMDSYKMASMVPRVKDTENIKPQPLLNLTSTYIAKAKGQIPMAGNTGPWLPRRNYLIDQWVASSGNLTAGLQFTESTKKVN